MADKTGFWTRMVADQTFREAVIEDPLRAVAAATDVAVSADQIRQLEDMSRHERLALVTDVVRDAFFKGAVSRFGPLRDDGALGPPAAGLGPGEPADVEPDDEPGA